MSRVDWKRGVVLAIALAALGGVLRLLDGAAAQAPLTFEQGNQLNVDCVKLLNQGRRDDARVLAQTSVAFWEPYVQSRPLDLANALSNLGLALKASPKTYGAAKQALQRALTLREAALKPDDRLLGEAYNNLATVCFSLGQPAEAERHWMRALHIARATDDTASLTTVLNNMGILYTSIGEPHHAEIMLRGALELLENDPKASLEMRATLHNSLAALLAQRLAYAEAERQARTSVQLLEQAGNRDRDRWASVLHNLAGARLHQGDLAEAETLFRQALSLFESLRVDSPNAATTRAHLALVLTRRADYEGAERELRQALDIYGRTGAGGEEVANTLSSLVDVLWARGDIPGALAWQVRAAEAREQQLSSILTLATDAQRSAYLATLRAELDTLLSLHLRAAPDNPEAARLALETLLRFKGRVLDAGSEAVAELRASGQPVILADLDHLLEARRKLSSFTLRRRFAPKDALAEENGERPLRDEVEIYERLLGQLRSRSASSSKLVTLDKVSKALPPGSALAELVVYWPIDPRDHSGPKNADARYAAYVLHADARVRAVDLGPIGPIDALVAEARKLLGSCGAGFKQVARQLHVAVMEPLLPLLGDTQDVFLSPDGVLNLMPLGALVDAQGEYVMARFTFTYLTSGRDLLRFAVQTPPREGALVLADPDYDAKPDLGGPAPATKRRSALGTTLGALRGTRVEAAALSQILRLPEQAVQTGAAASESRLVSVHGPSILHLATHGFSWRPDARAADGGRDVLIKYAEPPQKRRQTPALAPLFRSGVALAGANRRAGELDDGVLTAFELLGVDLLGTQLVTLSACDTGLGQVHNGDGVYGLRRAMVLAGSESQLTSLWQLPDRETSTLMADYYARLTRGEGRSEAMRQVQLSRSKQHPYFWASLILSGDPRPLHGAITPAR